MHASEPQIVKIENVTVIDIIAVGCTKLTKRYLATKKEEAVTRVWVAELDSR